MDDFPENWDELSKCERKKLKREMSRSGQKGKKLLGRIKSLSIVLVVMVALAASIYWWMGRRQILPPTDISGHVEQNPSAHILNEPMPLAIQKHMLEHADGVGQPGVVINYNCEDFECEGDLKEKLEQVANRYPEFVYVAPYPSMAKKLAMTRFGRIQTFDEFDEERLIRFIEEK